MTARTAPGPADHRRDHGPVAVALAALGTTLGWSESLAGLPGLAPSLPSLERTNFRGRTVSLRGGAGVALGAVAAGLATGRAGAPAALAAAAGGVAGLVDDLDAGAHDGEEPAKGLRGHLGALAAGRVTTGVVKIAVIGAGALAAGTMLARTRARPGTRTTGLVADAATSAVLIASWANLHNLLDLRPGRALKTACLTVSPLLVDPRPLSSTSRALAAGVVGAATAALPEDLMEDTMLGDTGANAIGALAGTAVAAHPSRVARTAAAAAGVALVLASERISFTRVIASTPVLAAVDALGRRE
ncbi:hypothetical protein [Actinomyces howellii]|uniref:Glycosyl transferase family 4 n=1 Tax=Actinomyces howellii TaxID=52771 RepID=A0A448HES9_9ACTO|nr:hypothetical protein [Actinomyces howellii]VEG26679.1 Uncharacterised protein [Actinomyces howellii]